MALIKAFRSALRQKLSQLSYQGYVVLERWELLSWFSREKITSVVWKEIKDMWENDFNDEVKLQVIKCDETTATQTFVVIREDRVKNIEYFMNE